MFQEPQGLPFSTSWVRTARVRAGTHKGQPVIRFDGELTEYEPGQDALDALLSLDRNSLSLDRPRPQKPPAEVIVFLERYGPLGLYFSHLYHLESQPFLTYEGVWTVSSNMLGGSDPVPLAEWWEIYHSRSFASTHLDPEFLTRADVFTHGYFESWHYVFSSLKGLLLTASRLAGIEDEFFKPDGEDNLTYINHVLNRSENSLRPAVRKIDGNLEWCFIFDSLDEALRGLMVQRIIGGATFATCQPCGNLFSSTGRKYCSDECMIAAQETKRRESTLLKEKRRLRELLRTRVEKHGLEPEKAKKLRQAINNAQDIPSLQAVAKKHGDIFARHTRDVESQRGRQK